MKKNKVQTMTISALLCAMGIVIPMFAPKIVVEPASFTLASHVSIFIAMFISPVVAIAVTLITALGFFIAGMFPLIVVLRALSHIVFVIIGAYALKKFNHLLTKNKVSLFLFALVLSIIHSLCELIIVAVFYFGNNISTAYLDAGFAKSMLILGVGTIIHSMIDFGIASVIWQTLSKLVNIPVSYRIQKVSTTNK